MQDLFKRVSILNQLFYLFFFLLSFPLAYSIDWSSTGQFSQGQVYFYSFLDNYLWNITNNNQTVYLNYGVNINISGGYYINDVLLEDTTIGNCSGMNSCNNILYSNNITPVVNIWNQSGDNVFLINTSKNVGIGTITPSSLLDLESDNVVLIVSDTNLSNVNSGNNQSEIVLKGQYWSGESDLSYSQARLRLIKDQTDGNAGSAFAIDVMNDAGANSVLTERIRIDANGKIGIGTTNPSRLLNLYSSSSSADPLLKIQQKSTGDASMVYTIGGGWEWTTGVDNSDGDKFKIARSSNLNANNYFVIDTSGDIGIGITNPTEKLHLDSSGTYNAFIDRAAATVRAYLTFGTGGSIDWYLGEPDTDLLGDGDEFFIGTGINNPKLWIESDGKISIGSTKPKNKLDVEGAVAIGTSYSGSNTAPNNGLLVEGNVGIGTTSPTYKFEIKNNGNNLFKVRDTGSAVRLGIGGEPTGNAITLGSYSDRTISGVSSLALASGLNKVRETNNRMIFDSSNGWYFWPTDQNPGGDPYGMVVKHLRGDGNTTDNIFLAEQNDGTDVFNIKANGNVGIGTTSPRSTLDIQGDMNITIGGGWIAWNGTCLISSNGGCI